MDQLPQWYLDEALPRLKRIDELTPIAWPNDDRKPWDTRGVFDMIAAREEWNRLMQDQAKAEVNAGL